MIFAKLDIPIPASMVFETPLLVFITICRISLKRLSCVCKSSAAECCVRPALARLQVIVIAPPDWMLIGICFFPFLMIKFLHFCADVWLVENV